jgi:hypothetical protein
LEQHFFCLLVLLQLSVYDCCLVASQVRDEDEEVALEFIRRNRRHGDVNIEFEEIKILENRFSRIGKEKCVSGKAYQEMTRTVIVSGALPKKVKELVKESALAGRAKRRTVMLRAHFSWQALSTRHAASSRTICWVLLGPGPLQTGRDCESSSMCT